MRGWFCFLLHFRHRHLSGGGYAGREYWTCLKCGSCWWGKLPAGAKESDYESQYNAV